MNNRFRKAVSVAAMSAGMLLGGAGLAWAATVIGTSITLDPGAGIQTATSAGNTALLQAYDVDGASYTTFATLTANNAPAMDLATGVTMGGNAIYYATGTDIPVTDGGTGASDAGTARTNLGLAIGTNVQAWDTDLDTWAGKTAPTGTVVGTSDTQTLTNKSIDLANNTLTGTTAQFNTALSDGSFATLAGTETLTNKTLTTPVIGSISNTGTLTLPTDTDTLVGRATTDTLTNKSIALGGNTLSGTTAQFNTALSDGDFVTLAGTETLTNKTITSPIVGPTILDSNSNELLNLTATGSAVNELTLANAATGNPPTLAASGDDANINIAFTPKGTGVVAVNGGLALGTNAPFSMDKGTTTGSGGAATLNKPAGTVTTASLTTGNTATYTLTLTNSFVTASSIVLATVSNNTNTGGAPLIETITPAAGSVTILVRNAGWGAGSFNGTLDIDFVVIN